MYIQCNLACHLKAIVYVLALGLAESRKSGRRRLQSIELLLIVKCKLHETFNPLRVIQWEFLKTAFNGVTEHV